MENMMIRSTIFVLVIALLIGMIDATPNNAGGENGGREQLQNNQSVFSRFGLNQAAGYPNSQKAAVSIGVILGILSAIVLIVFVTGKLVDAEDDPNRTLEGGGGVGVGGGGEQRSGKHRDDKKIGGKRGSDRKSEKKSRGSDKKSQQPPAQQPLLQQEQQHSQMSYQPTQLSSQPAPPILPPSASTTTMLGPGHGQMVPVDEPHIPTEEGSSAPPDIESGQTVKESVQTVDTTPKDQGTEVITIVKRETIAV